MAGLGSAAALAQLVLIRELLACFSGNELTIGVMLGCWMLLTAVGTAAGSLPPPRWATAPRLAGGTIVVALVAIAELLAIRAGHDLLFPRGVAGDPLGTIVVGLIALAPFCLGSGALLTLGCRALAEAGADTGIGKVYSADAAGSVAGAVVFTFVLSRTVDHVAALCWSATAACIIGAWISASHRRRVLLAASLAGALGLPAVALLSDLDRHSAQWQYHGRIVYRASSPYGRLVVTRRDGQLTFFENGAPVIFSTNAGAVEEQVHYALAQRPQAGTVLLIGGGAAGAAREVLRYPAIREVTCIELDPAITAAGRLLLPENVSDARITVVTGDGRQFLQRTRRRYDAILIGLPDPTTFQLNRFFTVEFFAIAKHALTPDGVLCFATGQYENYASPTLRQVIGSARRSVATVFAHTVVLPGGRVFFLASDAPLTRDVAGALERDRIEPKLISRPYLEAMFTADRLADMDRAAATAAPVNRDFHPTLYYLRLRQWLAQFRFPALGFGAALVAVAVGGLVRFRAVPRMVFAAGFAGSTLEIVMLVALQAFFGSVYQQVGLVVAAFMAGLAAGAAAVSAAGGTPTRARARAAAAERAVRQLGIAIAAVALLMAIALPLLGRLAGPGGEVGGQFAIAAGTFVLAATMGAQFAYAARATSGMGVRAAPIVFSADLIGAAVGAAAVSTLLLPLYGAIAVCGAAAGLNLVCVGLSLPRHRDA